jgi:2-deoxy-D-gluconate 3-dehydrogenase
MDLGLAERVAIVTGASRGLGRAAVLALAGEGMRVLAVARSADELETLAQAHPGRIETSRCDMRDAPAVQELPRIALERFGALDVIVNNAGIAPAAAFLDSGSELWQEILAVNVVAPALLARAAGPWMIERGGGKIINVSSISGVRGKAGLVAYSASKGALISQTTALAAEWARHNIQVNVIAPGGFATEAQQAVLDDADLLARRVRKIPARRMAASEEIGPLVCYLASPLSNFVTGAVLVIDGGEAGKL